MRDTTSFIDASSFNNLAISGAGKVINWLYRIPLRAATACRFSGVIKLVEVSTRENICAEPRWRTSVVRERSAVWRDPAEAWLVSDAD
ncbi:hypothetical protein WL99_19915 [Burkholderia cepacia]|nr:hypothetical protein WL99_19915 [Burkholderia cepacia]